MNTRMIEIIAMTSMFGSLDRIGTRRNSTPDVTKKQQTEFETIFGSGKNEFYFTCKESGLVVLIFADNKNSALKKLRTVEAINKQVKINKSYL